MDPSKSNRRQHKRYIANLPCRAILDRREIEGVGLDMSLSGAAIQLDEHPTPGTPIVLDIDDLGQIAAKVVRPITDGTAVEFNIDDAKKKRHLIAGLTQILYDKPLKVG